MNILNTQCTYPYRLWLHETTDLYLYKFIVERTIEQTAVKCNYTLRAVVQSIFRSAFCDLQTDLHNINRVLKV